MKVTQLLSATALLAGLFVLVTQAAAAQQTVSAAQEPTDPARVTVPASSASVSSPSASSPSALPGPRLPAEFRRAEPAVGSSLAVAGNHTIVVSTLVLVLAIVILVLLVAK